MALDGSIEFPQGGGRASSAVRSVSTLVTPGTSVSAVQSGLPGCICCPYTGGKPGGGDGTEEESCVQSSMGDCAMAGLREQEMIDQAFRPPSHVVGAEWVRDVEYGDGTKQ